MIPIIGHSFGGLLDKEKSIQYVTKGKQLLQAKNIQEALKYFSQAIVFNPKYTEAYQYRGHVLAKLGRIDEAKEDLRIMKSLQAEGEVENPPVSSTTPQKMKIDMQSVDDVLEDLTDYSDDELDFEDDLYDYAFSDDTYDSDSLLESLVSSEEDEEGIPAILEYVNGEREEVPWAYLFEPTEDEITLVEDQDEEGKIVFFDQLICIRLSRPPAGCPKSKDEACHVEIIETIDGNIFHEAIPAAQNLKNVLFGFSTKEDTRFNYTLIPLANIKKRFQRRHLGQIIVDKKLLTSQDLKNALEEHNELKKIKFGRVLAEHAKLLQPAVESEIQKAYSGPNKGRKIGEILLEAGLVNEDQIQEALAYQKRLHNRKLGSFLIEKGILQEKDVCVALAEKFRIPFVDLRHEKGSKKALSLLPKGLIQKLVVLPLAVKEDTLVVATVMPDPSPICDVILKHSPLKELEFVLVQPSHLKNVIKMVFAKK